MNNEDPVFTGIKITHQGAPIVNYALVFKQTEDITLILLDMKSKRCEVVSHDYDPDGTPLLGIVGSNESTGLDPAHEAISITEVAFPDLKGMTIWMDEGGRYSFKLCFVRKD